MNGLLDDCIFNFKGFGGFGGILVTVCYLYTHFIQLSNKIPYKQTLKTLI